MQHASRLPLLAGLAAASIWGGMYAVSKVVLDVIPPFCLLSLRLVLGFAALAVVIAFRGGWKRPTPRQLIGWLLAGFVGYGISLGFQFVGTKLTSAANGSLVTAATPALVLPFAVLLLKERLGWRSLLALAVASLGVVAVIDPRTANLASANFLGNLLLVGAALTWALYSVLVTRLTRDSDVLVSTAIMFLGGLPTSLALGAGELGSQGIGVITIGIIGGVLFLGLVSTAGAMFLWNYAFARLPATTASLTFFAQSLVGGFLGWAFLGEAITPLFIIGGVLIVAGLVIQSTGKSVSPVAEAVEGEAGTSGNEGDGRR